MIDLKAYLALVRRRKWIALGTLLVTLAIVIAGIWRTEPTYTASTLMQLVTTQGGSADWIEYDIEYADRLLNTYASYIENESVVTQVANELELTERPNVSVEAESNAEMFSIVVTHPDRVMVAAVADALAATLIDFSESQAATIAEKIEDSLTTQLAMLAQEVADAEAATITEKTEDSLATQLAMLAERTEDSLTPQLAMLAQEVADAEAAFAASATQTPASTAQLNPDQLSVELKRSAYNALLGRYGQSRFSSILQPGMLLVLVPATVPNAPSRSSIISTAVLVGLVGLIGGLILVFVIDYFDSTLYSAEIQSIAQSAILGEIPEIRDRKAAVVGNSDEVFNDAFRLLSANLLAYCQAEGCKSLLVTSSEPGEGKSTISVNLAMEMATRGVNVAIVDADLRNPKLHELLDVSNDRGLTTVLRGRGRLIDVLHVVRQPIRKSVSIFTYDNVVLNDNVNVITSGPTDGESQQQLGSPVMRDLFAALRQEYDMVLFDSAALGTVSDAALLSSMTDGVLLVLRAGKTDAASLQKTCIRLANLNARLVGIVLNRTH